MHVTNKFSMNIDVILFAIIFFFKQTVEHYRFNWIEEIKFMYYKKKCVFVKEGTRLNP
jgi:hypothetical protein